MIVVLGGGTLPRQYPRQTVELGEAGDRLTYAAHLFREQKAPLILCTSGVVPGQPADEAEAKDMRAFYEMIGIPPDAIIAEPRARNTREHAVYCEPIFKERNVKRILLVTSAAHMARSIGVFHRFSPGLEVVPAPTDFLFPRGKAPFWKRVSQFIPSAAGMNETTVALHEYIGLMYYKIRGWV
jgi:uncharacterized SAM-binding protein YcdF (DUF218 family)